jgi:hypothetical protein
MGPKATALAPNSARGWAKLMPPHREGAGIGVASGVKPNQKKLAHTPANAKTCRIFAVRFQTRVQHLTRVARKRRKTVNFFQEKRHNGH